MDRDPIARELKTLIEQKRKHTAAIQELSAERRAAEEKRRRFDQEADQARRNRDQATRELTQLKHQKRDAANQSVSPATTPATAGTAQPQPSQGLRATYFRSRNLTGKSVMRIDPVIDFDWKSGGPMSEVGVDNFSARWEGQLEAPTSGRFTFHTISNDGVRFWINGQKIIDQWKDQGATEHRGSIELKVGQRYDLKMEHYEANGTAVARLFWTGPDTPRAIVPSSRLFPRN